MGYNYLIVGTGIFGAVVAHELAQKGNKVLIIDRRGHLAGNIYSYTDKQTGIEVHQYGSHIFHTDSDEVWQYITKFADFNNYIHTVNTRHQNRLYPMPINLDTINLLYGANFDETSAVTFIAEEAAASALKYHISAPRNFEEKALTTVGEKLYTAFLKNYTSKQWHTDPKNLPASILNRIPVRFSHDNRYFLSAMHQGIPKNGYTDLIKNLLSLDNIKIVLNTDFKDLPPDLAQSLPVIYCGQIDELLDYQLGVLPYRSLRFEIEHTEKSLGQAVINEADLDVPYTRTHDYKYYQIHQPEVVSQKSSIICKEYPTDYHRGAEAYYPVNNPASEKLYKDYVALAKDKYPHLIPGGRLGAYRYWDMDVAVKNALALSSRLV